MTAGLRLIALIVATWLVALGATGCSMQRRLIYFPTEYTANRLAAFDAHAGRRIHYVVDHKPQTSFYIPPKTAPAPGTAPRIWVVCSGTSSLALDWFEYVRDAPVEDAGFLLVDYPGYGLSESKPTRGRIIAAVKAVWPALAEELGVSVDQLDRDVNLLGYSLGTAVGLEFAARRPVKRVVLLAPFTSMLAMARLRVPIVAETVVDRFDNAARLDELAARTDPPDILILHGNDDGVVPFRMGKALAERHPAITRFVEIDGVDHTGLPPAVRQILYREFEKEMPAPAK